MKLDYVGVAFLTSVTLMLGLTVYRVVLDRKQRRKGTLRTVAAPIAILALGIARYFHETLHRVGNTPTVVCFLLAVAASIWYFVHVINDTPNRPVSSSDARNRHSWALPDDD